MGSGAGAAAYRPGGAMITAALLIALGASGDRAALYVAPLRVAAARYDIDTPRRVAHWLAQLAHESARFGRVVENLNYSATALANTWPARYADMAGQPNATAVRIARRPEDIANLTYADRLGNGPAGSGDGWRYRGRGLIQVTGRDNYARCGQALGIDLIRTPELLEAPLYAALSAGWYWHVAALNALADADDLPRITRRINGGLNGLNDRAALRARAREALERG